MAAGMTIRAVWGRYKDFGHLLATSASSAASFSFNISPSACLTSNNFAFLIFLPMFLSETLPTLITEQQLQSLALGLIRSIFSITENA